MNIMFIIFSFNVGGIERLLIDMCNNMAKKNHHVYLCIINNDYTESLFQEFSHGVRIIKLDRSVGSLFSFKQMYLLAKIVRKKKIQILHCQGINCVLFSFLAKLLFPSMIILNTVHDSGNYPSYSALKIHLQNLICSMTIAISNSVKAEILTRHMNPSKVTTIYNAINTKKFQYVPRNNSLPLTEHQTIELGNVARFFPAKKGQDILVQSVELLTSKYEKLHCNFAGDIFKGQQDEYNNIQDYIHSHNLTSNFTFWGNVDDIPAFLQNIDIFILPSNFEGFGISLIEAMATGLPSIASNLQGPAEILSSPRLGTLFTAGNKYELAAAIDQMIHHYSEYDQQYISEYIQKNYDIETMVSKHLSVYETLLL